jgi:hypothetical protein
MYRPRPVPLVFSRREPSGGIARWALHSAFVPTVLRPGPYQVYFYSHEPGEPPHVHVDRDDSSAKFWLSPVSLAVNFGFPARELRIIEDIVDTNRERLIKGVE